MPGWDMWAFEPQLRVRRRVHSCRPQRDAATVPVSTAGGAGPESTPPSPSVVRRPQAARRPPAARRRQPAALCSRGAQAPGATRRCTLGLSSDGGGNMWKYIATTIGMNTIVL